VNVRFIARGLRDIGRHFATASSSAAGRSCIMLHRRCRGSNRLDMADHQESNLAQIRSWLGDEPGAFDWSIFISGKHGVLDAEDGRAATLAEREGDDARADPAVAVRPARRPAALGAPGCVSAVMSYYCAEWVIPSIDGWRETMRRVTSVVAPGGCCSCAACTPPRTA